MIALGLPLIKLRRVNSIEHFLRLTPNSKYYEVEVSCIFYKEKSQKLMKAMLE